MGQNHPFNYYTLNFTQQRDYIIRSDTSPNKPDLATSVHKREEEPKLQLSDDHKKMQPMKKQQSPRNDRDQLQNGMSKF